MKLLYILLIAVLVADAQEISFKLEFTSGMLYRNWAENDQNALCRLNIKTPPIKSTTADPVILILLYDNFPSRELDAIIGGMDQGQGILGPLHDGDYFGAVSFGKQGREAYPLQAISRVNRSVAINAIKTNRILEGRNLASGLKAVEQQLKNTAGVAASARYLFLITAGNSDSSAPAQDLEKIASLSESYGLIVKTFGYDMYFDETFLIEAAQSTGGKSFHIEKDDLDRLRTITTLEVRNSIAIGPRNVSLEITLPKGTTLSEVTGAKQSGSELQLGNLQPGSDYSVYLLLTQRPLKRRDPSIILNYTDPDDIVDNSDQYYLELPLDKTRGGYKNEQAPRLLEYGIWKILDEMSEGIYERGKVHRSYMVETLDSRIRELEEANVSINSDYLKNSIIKLTTLRDAIRNSAIEDSLVVKQIRFGFRELSYPEPIP